MCSTARNLKVGCVLVKDNRIISIGYNGTPSGWSNECEVEFTTGDGTHDHVEMITKPEVIHAEANAVAKLARSNESGEGSVAFITHAPCLSCAKMLYSAGIIEVVYADPYKSKEGLQFLEKCGIKVSQLYFEEAA
jgi:dCMP deaminase